MIFSKDSFEYIVLSLNITYSLYQRENQSLVSSKSGTIFSESPMTISSE